MRKPRSVRGFEQLGRIRLSPSFFMRDMLYSEIANFHGMPNIPDYPDIAIEAGRHLCEELLEPLQQAFGRVSVRSAYRSPSVNEFGAENGLNCASNRSNYAGHIWDYRDQEGRLGVQPVSSSTASSTTTRPPATGRHSHGGFTIICHIIG